MRMLMISCLAAATVVAATPAVSQSAGSRPTREFVQAAGQSDQFEILEGRVALIESANPQVRAFAEQMIQDHSGTTLKLRQATASSGLEPPPMGLGDDQVRLLGALQSLHGTDFDRVYTRHQALAHRSALTVQQGYASTGDVPAVRQAAASAVPMISAHLATAEELMARLGGP